MKLKARDVAIALAVGIFIGWFAAFGVMRCRIHGFKPGKMIGRFSRELKLDPGQEVNVGKILETTRARMAQIRRDSKAEISALLTPEQREKFDKLSAKWESRRR